MYKLKRETIKPKTKTGIKMILLGFWPETRKTKISLSEFILPRHIKKPVKIANGAVCEIIDGNE